MRSVTTTSDGAVILYDADVFGKIDAQFFDPEFWRDQGALIDTVQGRGATWCVRHRGVDMVLRHFRRGGFIAKFLHDRYLWTGLERTRAAREWEILDTLYRRGLPVPRPIAARIARVGLYYQADLLTERIPGAVSLSHILSECPLPPAQWQAIGQCIRRFHALNVFHADLNAHNILLAEGRVFLLDFDRGRLNVPTAQLARNIQRLKRSFDKLRRQRPTFHFTPDDWAALLTGYARDAM